jgi:hypothetical protein
MSETPATLEKMISRVDYIGVNMYCKARGNIIRLYVVKKTEIDPVLACTSDTGR